MIAENIIIFPRPKAIEHLQGYYSIPNDGVISIPYADRGILFPIARRLLEIVHQSLAVKLTITHKGTSHSVPISFVRNDFTEEEYAIDVHANGIVIGYGNAAGAFHAVSTLKQILVQCNRSKEVPYLKILDKPDFAARGIMLDISRNKVPTIETLYPFVDFMADLKLNQLQLYIEGFSFAYPSFPEIWENRTPMTGDEVILLDKYCKDRFIELVPNQNSFGHMMPWLTRAEFNELADCPNGFQAPWGWYDKPLTLNPLDPRSIALVEKMYDDLLPHFSSSLFNVGCDETFDLGLGKSKAECERIGKGRLYLDFLMKVYELADSRGKKMMFWGDIILHYPELIPELPNDIIAISWGYADEEPLAENCRQFSEANIPFYVCPGTSSWNSITGLTARTKTNLLNAAVRGKKYGAVGFLNADWGEGGHWHCLPVSYGSFCYGAALSWGVEENEETDIAEYLNRFVFLDRNNKMGQFVLDMGNYYLKEKLTAYDGSGIFRTLSVDQLWDRNQDLKFLKLPHLEAEDFSRVQQYVDELSKELDQTEMDCEDAELITAEYRNSIRLVLHGTKLGLYKLRKMSKEGSRLFLETMLEDLTEIIETYKRLWMKRNKSGGLQDSIRRLEELKGQYQEALQ